MGSSVDVPQQVEQPGHRCRAACRVFDVIAVLLLWLLLALVYARVRGFGYVGLDDAEYLLESLMPGKGLSIAGIEWAFRSFHMSNWHPLTWLSYMADISLFGPDPGVHHVVNVVLHGANSTLVYVFAVQMLRDRRLGLLVALLFLVHPLHVESVAWIAERKDVLCGLFFMLALLAWLRYVQRPTPLRYAVVVLAHLLALMSKPMAVTFPLLLLLLDWWPLQRLQTDHDAGETGFPRRFAMLTLEKIPLFVVSLASGIITIVAQQNAIASIERVPYDYRLMNAVCSVAAYVRDAVLPLDLAVIYPLEPIDFVAHFLPSLALVLLICVVSILQLRRCPWLLTGWCWFLVTLLPVLGLLQVGMQSRADRYMYLPLLGLLLALGGFMRTLAHARRNLVLMISVPAVAFYAFLAWIQVGFWSSSHMLFSRAIEAGGESAQAHIGLSIYYLEHRDVELAHIHALKAIRLSPRSSVVRAHLATVLLYAGDNAGAERILRAILDSGATDAAIMNNLGVALERQGREEEAQGYYRRASKADPNLRKLQSNMSRTER